MSRLVDTTTCPDCRAPLDATTTCTGCGVRLAGPLAVRLHETLQTADGLLEQLRAASPALVPAPVVGSAPLPPAPPVPTTPTRAPRGLPAASVPAVLLGLGALCLLVAAVVFVAVAWSVLGLTGRTLVLLGVTGLVTLTAVVVTRRALRGAAEALWLVVAGMLAVDLLGAHSAGLLGLDALGGRATALLVGLPLLGLGVAAGLWARTQPVARLYGVQAVALLGAVLAVASNAWGAERPAVGTAVAVPLLVVAALPLRRALRPVAWGLATLAALSWLVLALIGASRTVSFGSAAEWWGDLRGWPLLVVAAYAAAAASLLPVLPAVRSVLAGAAMAPLALLVSSPLGWDGPTTTMLLLGGTVVALAAATRWAPLVWARGAAALTALGVVGLAGSLTVAAWIPVSLLPRDGSATPGDRLEAFLPPDSWAPWVSGVLAVALVVALASLVAVTPRRLRLPARRVVAVLAAASAALGAAAIVLAVAPPLWAATVVLALGAALVGSVTWVLRDRGPAGAIGTLGLAHLLLLTLATADAAEPLLAVVLTVVAVVGAAAYALREQEPGAALSSGLLAVAGVLSAGAAVLAWQLAVGVGGPDSAGPPALAALAGLVAVGARAASTRPTSRWALEGSALALALTAVAGSAGGSTDALVLTLVGVAAALVAVLHRDRALVSWLAVGVLGAATVLRVEEGVSAPELYTLPLAALLLLAGAWRMRADSATTSTAALGSGLVLALLPSLLLTLDEPVSLRGALVAAAGLVGLTAGVRLRLAAPFAAGAVTTALLALRHLEPVAESVPRWITLGLVGVALLGVGITWESRLRDLQSARRYLAALR